MTTVTSHTPTLPEQAGALLAHVAGYASHRTISMGLRSGLIAELAEHPDGLTPDELAESLGLDPFYVGVWARSALAAGVCTRTGDGLGLAEHMDTLLLDEGSPAYVGGVFLVLEQHEAFDRFEEVLPSGERLWWDQTSPDWIAAVSRTGRPFYTRLIPGGLSQVPGLDGRLANGVRIVDTACGTGVGAARLAEHYPACEIVGVDGDAYSIQQAKRHIAEAGLDDRVTLHTSPLEDLSLDRPATLVVNNLSMHECRDIDRATERVRDCLEPGGWFVISDFPFPDTDDGLATSPGRIMSAIQFFEAQIDDQLLPRSVYDGLLARHSFTDLGWAQLTPVHALTWGRRT
jgi:SAM-dependent methyltransferase